MKKIFLSLSLVLFVSLTISAQSVTPPPAANNHVQKNWAGATVQWTQSQGQFVAQITSGTKTIFAFYSDKGVMGKMKTQISWGEVPSEVMMGHKTSANNIYPPFRQYRVEDAGVVSYEIVVENAPSQFLAMNFDNKGKLLSENAIQAGN